MVAWEIRAVAGVLIRIKRPDCFVTALRCPLLWSLGLLRNASPHQNMRCSERRLLTFSGFVFLSVILRPALKTTAKQAFLRQNMCYELDLDANQGFLPIKSFKPKQRESFERLTVAQIDGEELVRTYNILKYFTAQRRCSCSNSRDRHRLGVGLFLVCAIMRAHALRVIFCTLA